MGISVDFRENTSVSPLRIQRCYRITKKATDSCKRLWLVTIAVGGDRSVSTRVYYSYLIIFVNPSGLIIWRLDVKNDVRRPSKNLTFRQAVEIWQRILQGEFQNRIAADYDVNPGRISDIKMGRLHPGSEVVALT
jgi:hypothetical protein